MSNTDDTNRKEVQQGETFTYTQDISHIAETLTRGFLGATIVAEARDPLRELAFAFPLQPLSVGQEEVTFQVPADITAGWVAGEWVVMQILINGGDGLNRVIEPTIHIKVREGFVRPRTTGLGTGSFDSSFDSRDFNEGTNSPQGDQ